MPFWDAVAVVSLGVAGGGHCGLEVRVVCMAPASVGQSRDRGEIETMVVQHRSSGVAYYIAMAV